MKTVLQKYVGQTIGINLDKAFKLESAQLTGVDDDHFTVVDSTAGYTHHFAYTGVVQVVEHPDGVDVGGLFTHKDHFTVVVKVGHLLEYVPP